MLAAPELPRKNLSKGRQTPSTSNGHRGVDATGALMIAATTGLMFVAYYALPADDAFIVARYVDQLYRGHGLVFNVGERINAITSPLLTWTIAALHPLSSTPVTLYRIAAAVVVVWTLLEVAKRFYSAPSDRLLFAALALASPFVVFWSISGLETPLLLCCCTWLTYCALRLLSGDGNESATRAAQVIGLAAAAVLLRYDAVLYVGPPAAVCLYKFRRSRRVVGTAVFSAVAVGLWLAFTAFYYGDILPTSFYVKLEHSVTADTLFLGLAYVVSFSVLSLLAPVAATPPWKRYLATERRTPTLLALVVGAAAQLAYGLAASTQHMMYAYRLFVPYLPSLVLLFMPAQQARRGWREFLSVIVILYQATIGLVLYYLSENPNLSLLFWKQDEHHQWYEFSTFGARNTKEFLAAVRRSAPEIRAHWVQVAAHERPMKVLALTGGTLPYLLPSAYVFETLVSYRHHCGGDLASAADYVQLIQNADAPVSPAARFGVDARNWQLVSKHVIEATGLQEKPYRLRIDIWYNKHPSTLVLPPSVDLPCQG